jgi:cbb3-type cytochrome oxidase cytochrome c subunit
MRNRYVSRACGHCHAPMAGSFDREAIEPPPAAAAGR